MEFPNGFGWGVATASYQVEGAVDEDGRAPSIWDTFAHTPGRIVDGNTGDVATDHYHRYAEDVELLAGLGVTHYRFSLAWPRIQPDGRGPANADGLDFYARLIDALLEHGIEPWVTLYHWDLPQALQDRGGWPERDTAYRFADYAALAYEHLHDRVPNWTTLNEPWCSAFLGYASGVHAPGVTESAAAMAAAHHLMLGHGLAVPRMRELDPGTTIGVTVNLYPCGPASDSAADADATRRIDGQSNRLFCDPMLRGRYPADVLRDVASVTDAGFIRPGDEETIGASVDLLGVNYYSPRLVRGNGGQRSGPGPSSFVACDDVEFVPYGFPRSDMGWEIEPDGLRRVLVRLHEDYPDVPLYVTENGIALPDRLGDDGRVDDPDRIAYVDGHLRAVRSAIDEGADVRGYFLWTFTDNFEWSFGFSKRFGLYHVDFDTQVRTPKTSAGWFAQVATRNALPEPGAEVR